MAGQGYKDLTVWTKSMDFVADVYCATKTFPKEETYGLSSQMRRAAISIPSNLAEGHAKRTTRDFLRFANTSYGSAAELETQILIARKLSYLTETNADTLLERLSEIARMLSGLATSLEKKLVDSP